MSPEEQADQIFGGWANTPNPRMLDRDGQPMTPLEWDKALGSEAYRRVALTHIGEDVSVSTVWLGTDYGMGLSPAPIIYETMVFGGPMDQYIQRYPTAVAAQAGHDQVVAEVKDRMA